MPGDIGPILGADKTPATKKVRGDVVGRPISGSDCDEIIDRRRDLCARGQ
jgi:hypothetical protein